MFMSMESRERKILEHRAELLKAIAHPVRLCMIKNLIETGGCNVTNMQLCLSMPQSTISQHLSKLKALGIVEGTRNGTEIVYKAVHPDAINIVNVLIPSKKPFPG